MRIIALVLAIVCVHSLWLDYQQDKRIQLLTRASEDLLLILSSKECDEFYRGDRNCVESQVRENRRWYLAPDGNKLGGPPGVPGPTGVEVKP